MTENLSNQEQVQLVKNWWKKYGTVILTGVLVFLATNYGWQYWRSYKAAQAEQASAIYSAIIGASETGKTDQIKPLAERLQKDFSSTPYASLAMFTLAKNLIQQNQLPQAEEKLRWIMKHSAQDSLRQLAQIRLDKLVKKS